MTHGKFFDEAYFWLLKVPRGKVTTYGEIARAMGGKAYRGVGLAMKNNKNSPKIPCHRVVKSNGEIGGFAFGVEKKIEMLEKEGVSVENGRVDMRRYFFGFC